MGLQYFKPNKSVKGAAVGFSFNSKDEAVYIELIKQTGWDEEKRQGSFKEGLKANVKLSLTEAAAFIDTIETTLAPSVASDKATLAPVPRPFSGFHSSPKGTTKIAFNPYFLRETKELKGLSLSVKKSAPTEGGEELSFLVGLTHSEAVLLREYLKFALQHCFSAIYSSDKKRAEDYKKKVENNAECVEDPI